MARTRPEPRLVSQRAPLVGQIDAGPRTSSIRSVRLPVQGASRIAAQHAWGSAGTRDGEAIMVTVAATAVPTRWLQDPTGKWQDGGPPGTSRVLGQGPETPVGAVSSRGRRVLVHGLALMRR